MKFHLVSSRKWTKSFASHQYRKYLIIDGNLNTTEWATRASSPTFSDPGVENIQPPLTGIQYQLNNYFEQTDFSQYNFEEA
jgi:hypothetical protein